MTALHHMSREEFNAHKGTFSGFSHLIVWFIAHLALLLAGLFVMGVAGLTGAGLALIAISVIVLGVGLATTPKSADRVANR